MDEVSEDLNNRILQDDVYFSDLIDQTEAGIKEKLSVLMDPELSTDPKQSDEHDGHDKVPNLEKLDNKQTSFEAGNRNHVGTSDSTEKDMLRAKQIADIPVSEKSFSSEGIEIICERSNSMKLKEMHTEQIDIDKGTKSDKLKSTVNSSYCKKVSETVQNNTENEFHTDTITDLFDTSKERKDHNDVIEDNFFPDKQAWQTKQVAHINPGNHELLHDMLHKEIEITQVNHEHGPSKSSDTLSLNVEFEDPSVHEKVFELQDNQEQTKEAIAVEVLQKKCMFNESEIAVSKYKNSANHSDTTKASLSKDNVVQQTVVEDQMINKHNNSISDINRDNTDSLSCISIVSVEGAYNKHDEVGLALTDKDIDCHSTQILDKQNKTIPVTVAREISLSSNTSKDTAVLQCNEKETQLKNVSNLKDQQTNRQDPTDDTGSLLIVDVRSLSQPKIVEKDHGNSKQAMEQEKVLDINPKVSTTGVTKSYSTSKAIDALEVMCSSVPIGLPKQNTNMTVSTASLNKSVSVVLPGASLSGLSQNSDTRNQGLPVISHVFSIKEEPQMEFMCGSSGGNELSNQDARFGSRRKRKQPVTSPIVNKKAVKNNDIRQIQVPVSSNNSQILTEKLANSFPRPILAKPVTSESPVVVQLVKTTGSTNCSKVTPKVLTIAQTGAQKILTASCTPKTLVTQTPGITAAHGKKSVSKCKSSELDNSTSEYQVQNDLPHVKMEPVNIKNVGVAKITELIARRNPLPTYKPPSIPENLKTLITSRPCVPCYECGDSFLFKKSLHNHLSRRSMKISFKCEACKTTLTFTNKCQMLSHLRTHLNIKNSQAVPIHIKSDSIEISTQYDELSQTKEFRFFDDVPERIKNEDNKVEQLFSSCHFCSYQYKSLSDKQSHYRVESLANIFCDQCPLYMSNVCSMKAHKTIHAIDRKKGVPEFLVCPECGEVFSHKLLDDFLKHLKLQCFHLSRFGCFLCKKCKYVSSCLSTMKNHLLSNMDTYYKCESCPMALRSLKNFYSHYLNQHGSLETNTRPKAKIIYRCHYCDTLIDDRVFLESHIQNHVNEMKALAGYMFNCLQCGQIFPQMKDLKAHYNQKHKMLVKRLTFCTFCSKDFGNMNAYVSHVLVNHTSNPSKVKVNFCDICGLVCVGQKMLRSHPCLMKIKVYGDPEAMKEVKEKEPSKESDTTEFAQKTKERLVFRKESCGIKATPSDPTSPPHFSLALPVGISPTCKACGADFQDKIHRINHLKKHRNENIFICISCDNDTFKTYHQLRSHEISCVSVNNKNTCERIDKPQTARKKTSPTKIKITRKENDYTVKLIPESDANGTALPATVEEKRCDKCDAVFTRETKLQEHIKLEHGLHPCHLCGLMHESQSSLKKHLILSHEGKKLRYYCFICKGKKIARYFSEKMKLEKHLRQKHRLKKWDDSKIVPELPGLEGKGISPEPEKRKLETENTVVNTEERLTKKLKTGDENLQKCSKCLFTSGLREDFLKHILEHKSSSTVQCLECGLCFAVLPSLRKHLFMVHKVRNFEAYCAANDIKVPTTTEVEAFTEIGQDTNESNIDSDIEDIVVSNPLECQVCYKEFENEAALKGHMRVHGMALIKRLRRKSHTPNGRSVLIDTTQSSSTSSETSAIRQNDSETTNKTLESPEDSLTTTNVGNPNAE